MPLSRGVQSPSMNATLESIFAQPFLVKTTALDCFSTLRFSSTTSLIYTGQRPMARRLIGVQNSPTLKVSFTMPVLLEESITCSVSHQQTIGFRVRRMTNFSRSYCRDLLSRRCYALLPVTVSSSTIAALSLLSPTELVRPPSSLDSLGGTQTKAISYPNSTLRCFTCAPVLLPR